MYATRAKPFKRHKADVGPDTTSEYRVSVAS